MTWQQEMVNPKPSGAGELPSHALGGWDPPSLMVPSTRCDAEIYQTAPTRKELPVLPLAPVLVSGREVNRVAWRGLYRHSARLYKPGRGGQVIKRGPQKTKSRAEK
jgi:hypothetical protein